MLNPGWVIYLLCDLKKSLKFSKLLQCEASKSLLPEGCETTTHDGRQCLTRGACSKMGILLPKASTDCNKSLCIIIMQEQ